MNNYIYKERRSSKIEEMFSAVFTSKAVLALIVVSFIVFLGSVFFSVMYFGFYKQLTLENAGLVMELFPEFEGDITEFYSAIFYMTNVMGGMFLILAVVYLWIAVGTLMIYRRSKVLDSQYSPRAGFTVLQAFGITKIVFEGLATFTGVFLGLGMLQDSETFLAGIITCVFIGINFMYTVSIIAFCASAKKTIDGVMPSSSGAGPLQFSAFITGLFTGIISVLCIIGAVLMATQSDTSDIQNEFAGLSHFFWRFTLSMGILFLVSVINFLVFAVVRQYAKKLPLADNAERVYRQNVSNLYPEQQYSPNQTYQSPNNYNGYTAYQPQNSYNGYTSYQPQENNNGYVPYQQNNSGYSTYNPTGDVDAASHSQPDNTPYPPYNDMTRKY